MRCLESIRLIGRETDLAARMVVMNLGASLLVTAGLTRIRPHNPGPRLVPAQTLITHRPGAPATQSLSTAHTTAPARPRQSTTSSSRQSLNEGSEYRHGNQAALR